MTTVHEEIPYAYFSSVLYPPREERLIVVGPTSAAQFTTSVTLDVEAMRAHVSQADAAERRTLALRFAERASSIIPVREVWLAEGRQEAVLTLIAKNVGLDEELQLEALFARLLADGSAQFDGYLRIYSESDGVPDFARSGEQLPFP
jgi:hypothetical protein